MPASDLKRYSNAHNAEAAVALYERAEDSLRCCHDYALNKSELSDDYCRSRSIMP
jgi:hypothetical protein